MVIWSELRMMPYKDGDPREYTPHFSSKRTGSTVPNNRVRSSNREVEQKINSVKHFAEAVMDLLVQSLGP